MPKISVIIPVYNVEQYLDKCMQSVINQTMQDIEIICINDGSTDNSLDILKKYAESDKRIVLIDQVNGGLSVARNSGLKVATAPYITFVDSDDWLELNSCEIMYNAMISNDCDLVQFKMIMHYNENHEMQEQDENYFNGYSLGLIKLNLEDIITTPVCACSKLFKKEMIDTYKISFPKGLYYEDNPFIWEYLSVTKNILFIEDKLYNYLRRPSSIMSKAFSKNYLIGLDHIKIFFGFYDFLQKWNLYNKYEKAFWELFEDHFWYSLTFLNQKDYILAFKLANNFLKDKSIEHLENILTPKIYTSLKHLKDKKYNKIYTFKEKNILKKILNFIFIKQYKKYHIVIKILGIQVSKKEK